METFYEINASLDGAGYDLCAYQPDSISDANNLYDAWQAARKNSRWKPKVQEFELNCLSNIAKLQREIEERTYVPRVPSEFIIRERGKTRHVRGGQVRDRVVEHSLNDNVVVPAISPYLIYDNGASQKNKGVDFTRKRLVQHLVKYYNKYGNDGYILLMDFTKYYDNIEHDKLYELFTQYVDDETALYLIKVIIDSFVVDVSYMTDEEYETCLDDVFSSLAHYCVDKSLLTGEKFMAKHLDIGNQTSQSAAILYPIRFDNYIKIVKGEKFYARYMDDSYVIHPSKKHLQELFSELQTIAAEYGIHLSEKKCRIVKLSSLWRFLQIQYSLTDTGRIIRKINPKRVTKMRQKMKKRASQMTTKEFHDWFFSWLKSYRKYMSKQQYKNMMELYDTLLPQTKKEEDNNDKN